MTTTHQAAFGQFFTPKHIADFMVKQISHDKNNQILEPSSGEGVFLDALQEQQFNNITAYEIDPNLIQHSYVINESFLNCPTQPTFDVVIGNPPYVRWKNLNSVAKEELAHNLLWQNHFNSLCDYLYIFILKSILLLKDNGELIFICPDYWFSTKYAQTLRQFMLQHGGFETIIRFQEANIFKKVNSSITIFKYRKTQNKPKFIKIIQLNKRLKVDEQLLNQLETHSDVETFEIEQFNNEKNWLFAPNHIQKQLNIFEQKCPITIQEICDIGNGMVSGLDKAFQINQFERCTHLEQNSSIQVAKAKDLQPFSIQKVSHYIFVENQLNEQEFYQQYPNFYQHLLPYREQLNNRYSYNKTIPFWEWSFLRNYQLFSRNERKILVPCKERITHKNYFRFALVDTNIYPTQDVTALFKKENVKENLEYIVAYLNQPAIFEWLKYKGVIKGGIVEFSEKPLASIPFRPIDWHNAEEVLLHEKITQAVQNYQQDNESKHLQYIQNYFQQLGISS
ncbi:Eco57I restriction-modification methylase domain-containing protein [Kingella kingae]|uniref:Eco57I restriction-modification methylase domain-containing protein n=1 Tax=Kingella kingae TaxID=504 RepID=UPI00254C2AF4|nr:N-6 DNA methylase [Kingella kingae]MDK4575452.1 N-6 DNA methylase [Kingella kingae]MDK4607548.1 N-6 DNA methylase [Kingella kingae]